MPQAKCRCGQLLSFPEAGSDRLVCPKCHAKVRVRRANPPVTQADGYIRFPCPCGRRLKVSADRPPESGKCPDCGRVVRVPSANEGAAALAAADPELPTEELGVLDQAKLDEWARRHLGRPAEAARGGTATQAAPAASRVEAGLRVCPRCGRPIHLGAESCRECGTPVPKR